MEGSRRWRWGRVLLVLAGLFGVVAMHSTVGPTHLPAQAVVASAGEQHQDPITASAVVASMQFLEHTVAAVGASSDMPGHGPMPISHALMHLCVAILSAGIVLGLLAVALVILLRHELTPSPATTPVATRPSRPPRRSALRLADLCVLRN